MHVPTTSPRVSIAAMCLLDVGGSHFSMHCVTQPQLLLNGYSTAKCVLTLIDGKVEKSSELLCLKNQPLTREEVCICVKWPAGSSFFFQSGSVLRITLLAPSLSLSVDFPPPLLIPPATLSIKHHAVG